MTTHLRITDTGGNIGRIHWRNSLPLPYRSSPLIPGRTWWSQTWPNSYFDAIVAKAARAVNPAIYEFARLGVSAEQAVKNIERLREIWDAKL